MSTRRREQGQLRKRCCNEEGACDCDPRKYLIRVYLGRVQGKRKYVSKTLKDVTRKQAERYLRKWLRDLDTNTFVEPSEDFLIDYLEKEYLPAKQAEVAESTLENYDRRIEYQIEPHLGHFKLNQLSRGQIQAWINHLADEYAPSTVQQAHTVLKSALSLAVRDGRLPANPAKGVSRPARRESRANPMTREEADRVLEAFEGSRYYTFWRLLFATGMRPQEALALQWEDVDFDNRRITINRAIKANGKPGETKTKGSRRTVTLPTKAYTALREHRKAQIKEQWDRGPEWNTEGWVFATKTSGRPPAHSNLFRHWKKVLKRVGIEERRMYDIRHSHATWLMSAGTNPRLVADRLGHSTVKTTLDIYSHVQPEDRDAVATLLDQMDQKQA